MVWSFAPVCYGSAIPNLELDLELDSGLDSELAEEFSSRKQQTLVNKKPQLLEAIAPEAPSTPLKLEEFKDWTTLEIDPPEIALEAPHSEVEPESNALTNSDIAQLQPQGLSPSEPGQPGSADNLSADNLLKAAGLMGTSRTPLEIQGYQAWQQAQAPVEIEVTPADNSEDADDSEDDWRFEIQPTILVPFSVTGTSRISGDLIQLDRGNLNIPPGLLQLGNFIRASDGLEIELPPDFSLDNFALESIETDIDLGLGDILGSDAIFRISGRVEAWKGDFGLFFEGMYSYLRQSEEITLGPFQFALPNQLVVTTGSRDIDVRVVSEQGLFDFGVTYSFDFPLGDTTENESGERTPGYPIFSFQPIVGGHVGLLTSIVDLDPGEDIGFSEVYVGPLAGGRLVLKFSDAFSLGVRGHVSSFGIGGATEWTFLAGLDWRLSRLFSLRAAYRIYDLSYETENDGRNFELDTQEQGLWLGLTLYLPLF
ncbi:MAG: hypothetical protein HC835_18560 [Oscillatoriales cyanobacterium RM2_1_1]|nr:hypothetical protein [Oscillatoriales cyanobacterium SM2_3_0]NJO47447.1 hypothetical protein [Oscillatoriales cyanobacterium RM2_1_1]